MTAAETRALRAVGDAVACVKVFAKAQCALRAPALRAARARLGHAFAEVNRMPADLRPHWRSKVTRMRNWITATLATLEASHARRA